MFYDNLENACKLRGVKVTPTITQCGFSKGLTTKWKQGVTPSSDIVVKLAEYLNVSTDYLLLGKDSTLTEKQQKLLDLFGQLTSENQARVLERAEMLKDQQE